MYDRYCFRPLRIRAYLQCGVISDKSIPLDAILYFHYVRDRYGEQDVTIPGQSMIPEGGDVSLPFQKIEGNEQKAWYYACSFARWPEETVEDRQFYVKQFRANKSDLIDFQGKRGRVYIERGRYKSYHINAYYRHALHIDWYAVGDPGAIRNALRFCTHLGKKTSQGWGAVKEWEVTDWPEDWSVKDGQGRLMRAIPSDRGNFVCGIRPSYWHRKHQFYCLIPSDE